MKFKLEYSGIYVSDLGATVAFFKEALGLEVKREKRGSDRSIAFLGCEDSSHLIEVIQLDEHPSPYDLGERSTQIAFRVDDFDAAHTLHKTMGCIHHELPEYGVYFIETPDGYLCEVMPTRS